MLADIDDRLPPIIVHRATSRVIDGMHRLHAALMRGDETIEVRFFDGSPADAFVLAVKANIEHGRPLSLADRNAAAERIIVSHPTWSDRAIAAAAGLGARSVAEIRRRLADGDTGVKAPRARMGRDGRWRPIEPAEGRLKAADIIRERPDASVREVARVAGISPATALDVRNRMQRGEDPVPPSRPIDRRSPEKREPAAGRADSAFDAELNAMLWGLTSDPSLRFSESGRKLLRWVLARVVRPGEWRDHSDGVPNHCRFILVDIARQCADEWEQVAHYLERQVRSTA